MIQIDMPMPDNCNDCPFCDSNIMHLCQLMPSVPILKDVSVFDKDRPPHCPLQEVPEKKDFEFEIPEKCGDCKSMAPYGKNYYCHMQAISPNDPNKQQDISTIFLDPESRPEWCPIVKMNDTFKSMPPDRREEFDKIATGLSALFGSMQMMWKE